MDSYKMVLTAAASILKERGYKKKGNLFYLLKENNYGMIGFQKSQSSTKDYTKFTINIGISSGALRQYVDLDDPTERPAIECCHWQSRIGGLMPSLRDFWWELHYDERDEDVVYEVVKQLKEVVVLAIDSRISDEDLIEQWRKTNYVGTSLFKKYVYLTTLLKLAKCADLAVYIEEFLQAAKGKPFERDAKQHISDLDGIN